MAPPRPAASPATSPATPPARTPEPEAALPPTLSVIIPANNEEGYIGACLSALIASDFGAGTETGAAREIIVAANGCTDATVPLARRHIPAAEAAGWTLLVLDIPAPGKLGALNLADRAARGTARVYLDADIIVSPPLIAGLRAALDRPEPTYASGRLTIPRARSWITRAYSRVWLRVPFMTDCVPGCGVFAVNAAGRARWGDFPAIIADDTFVRLSFAPHERVAVAAPFSFPMIEGFSPLVRVRRRQDAGVTEVAARFPALMANEDKPAFGPARLARLAASDPVGLAVYLAVAAAVRLGRGRGRHQAWSRGR